MDALKATTRMEIVASLALIHALAVQMRATAQSARLDFGD